MKRLWQLDKDMRQSLSRVFSFRSCSVLSNLRFGKRRVQFAPRGCPRGPQQDISPSDIASLKGKILSRPPLFAQILISTDCRPSL